MGLVVVGWGGVFVGLVGAPSPLVVVFNGKVYVRVFVVGFCGGVPAVGCRWWGLLRVVVEGVRFFVF
ncbi:hypothetical protein CFELI_13485 [Corynebacterium felinum]|uniref:Transmembrane protein n=1 Tax=Corynebacterium felinum TaxID=131318 RepID=A0ABU2BDZ5_9CORY|nr:hypothetical protein [Corynebacterium felinum]MDR7354399.1 hypothetical protein [Corynebacterium felinum]MDR7354423.1 hypothetical protein [Corynebacterium felinum]MDR7354579.1 hypothetical protein [Corynebacterium felinum]MDR7355245.1 hypothetical protein [Corynebacterium felinum]